MPSVPLAVQVLPSYEAVSDRAFGTVAHRIRTYPECVLGLATGSTPVGLYQRLSAAALDWSRVTTFNLDEYSGLAPAHPQSYHHFMWMHLFKHVNVTPANVHIPRESEGGEAFEARIVAAGGIDLQVLGIGGNGHIGFNEPGSPLDSRTRRVALARRTITDNARFFKNSAHVPGTALTMGIGTIMEARTILLIACGTGKSMAVARALEGPVTSDVPASALQLHTDVHVLLDEAAASRLAKLPQLK